MGCARSHTGILIPFRGCITAYGLYAKSQRETLRTTWNKNEPLNGTLPKQSGARPSYNLMLIGDLAITDCLFIVMQEPYGALSNYYEFNCIN